MTPIEVAEANRALLKSDFADWLKENIRVYVEFERRALDVARFRTHYSGYTILEVMRHNSAIGELGSEFKLNNNRCADLCRLFSLCNPQHSALFEFRVRKAA